MLKASGMMVQKKRRLCQRDIKVDTRITFLLLFFCDDSMNYWQDLKCWHLLFALT